MAHEDEPSLPASFWTTLRRDEPSERVVDRAYFRFTMAHAFRPSPPRVIHYLVFGFVAGVAAVSAAASGKYWLLRWLPLVPHESRASSAWVDHATHRPPLLGGARTVPSASASAPAVVHQPPTEH